MSSNNVQKKGIVKWLAEGEELERAMGAAGTLRVKDAQPTNARRKEFLELSGKQRSVNLGSAADAVCAINNDFGSWGSAAVALYLGHVAWLAKEFFWILMIPYPAIFFGVSAWIFFVYSIARRIGKNEVSKFYQEAPVDMMINVMQVFWQTSNVLLMGGVFGYHIPVEVPGYAKDMVRLSDCMPIECEDKLDTFLWIARIGFLVTFSLWAMTCIALLYFWLTPPNLLTQGYAFQTCLFQGGWVAFWVLKDFLWTFDDISVAFALIVWGIHFIILCIWLVTVTSHIVIVDGLDEEETRKLSDNADFLFHRANFSYVVWSLGSVIWLLCENAYDEDLALRYVAAGFVGLSFLLYCLAFNQVKSAAMANDLFIRKLREESVDDYPAVHDLPAATTPEAQVVGKENQAGESEI